MSEKQEIKKIWGALAAINLAIEPIKKDQKNSFQGYNFRGIDQVYNLLQSIYSKNKVMPFPRVLSRKTSEHSGKDGKIQFKVEQEMVFKLLSLEDGTFEEIGPIWGEAMDTSDKGTNKSNSAAAKYAFLMAHLIPTEELKNEDADNDNPEAIKKPEDKKPASKPENKAPQGKPPGKKTLKDVFEQASLMILANPAELVIDFGTKFKGKKMSDLSYSEIEQNIEYWEKQDLSTIPNNISKFLANANQYLILRGHYPPERV